MAFPLRIICWVILGPTIKAVCKTFASLAIASPIGKILTTSHAQQVTLGRLIVLLPLDSSKFVVNLISGCKQHKRIGFTSCLVERLIVQRAVVLSARSLLRRKINLHNLPASTRRQAFGSSRTGYRRNAFGLVSNLVCVVLCT